MIVQEAHMLTCSTPLTLETYLCLISAIWIGSSLGTAHLHLSFVQIENKERIRRLCFKACAKYFSEPIQIDPAHKMINIDGNQFPDIFSLKKKTKKTRFTMYSCIHGRVGEIPSGLRSRSKKTKTKPKKMVIIEWLHNDVQNAAVEQMNTSVL